MKTFYESVLKDTSKTLRRLPLDRCYLKTICEKEGVDYITQPYS